MPIYHEVFDGNPAEAPTLQPTLKEGAQSLSHIHRRLVVVADRACCRWTISMRCQTTGGLRPGSGIHLAVQAGAMAEDSSRSAADQRASGPGHDEIVAEASGKAIAWWWRTTRCRRPSKPRIASRIHALSSQCRPVGWQARCPGGGAVQRGRKLSDSGAKARFSMRSAMPIWRASSRWTLKCDLFTYSIDEAALATAQMMDGKS